MREPTIALFGHGVSADQCGTIINPIMSAMRACGVAARVRELVEVGGSAVETAAGILDAEAALIVLGGASAPAGFTRLLDRLDEALIPAVVLAVAEPGRLRALQSEHVIVMSASAGAEAVGAVLGALVARQPAVRALASQLRLSQTLHGGAAAQIDRMTEELLLAARVQGEFLPKQLPVVPGLEVATLFRPAGFVSGDIYDVLRLDEHHIGFYLADAMGHGVPAALMTLFLAGHLSLKRIRVDGYELLDPAAALGRVNAAMFGCRGGTSRIASAVCGIIDTRNGDVAIASAGHPKPVRLVGSEMRPVEMSGMLLGVLDNPEFNTVRFRLDPGDMLLLHSDGCEHLFPPLEGGVVAAGGGDGEPHHGVVAGRIADCGERTASTVLSHFRLYLDHQSGSLHQPDDITILVLARPEEKCGEGCADVASHVAA